MHPSAVSSAAYAASTVHCARTWKTAVSTRLAHGQHTVSTRTWKTAVGCWPRTVPDTVIVMLLSTDDTYPTYLLQGKVPAQLR